MSFDRHKRMLLGVLALLTPLPLPFNQVVGWGWLVAFWVAVGLFLRRTAQGDGEPLTARAMNILALGYLPVLAVDFVLLWDGRPLRPLLHLALFALVVKLFGMRREKEKWHVFLLIFFLFLAAMGTSVHPAVLLYLASFLGLSILVLARFAGYHVLTAYGVGRVPRLGLAGFLAGSTLLTLLIAAPIFALLPRLGRPYMVGPVVATSAPIESVGFSDEITLDVIGRVRTSRAVALRVAYESSVPAGHLLRLRSATYSQFRGAGWRRGRREHVRLRRERDGFFHVAPGRPRSWLRIWAPGGADPTLTLPVESVVVDAEAPTLELDSAGIAHGFLASSGSRSYRAGLSADPLPRLPISGYGPPGPGDLDRFGISPAISELAGRVAGGGSEAERARRIETHLAREYEYTLDLIGGGGAAPVEDFLFRWRRGHCEFFASAMVLMLRAQEIPARLATGFLGGEFNPFEGYYIVRQSNAHAWVEAFVDDQWLLFDPTPPAGRPMTRSRGWGLLMSQAYDFVVFRWDRYVLTYGFYDQLDLARRLRSLWLRLRGTPEAGESPSEPAPRSWTPGSDPEGPAESPLAGLRRVEWLGLGLLAMLLGAWVWRHRPAFTATRAYRALRARLQRRSMIGLEPSAPPLAVAGELARRFPPAAGAGRRVIAFYLRESFGGEDLSEEERRDLRGALREAMRGVRGRGSGAAAISRDSAADRSGRSSRGS